LFWTIEIACVISFLQEIIPTRKHARRQAQVRARAYARSLRGT
jgi:hypothetical protein